MKPISLGGGVGGGRGGADIICTYSATRRGKSNCKHICQQVSFFLFSIPVTCLAHFAFVICTPTPPPTPRDSLAQHVNQQAWQLCNKQKKKPRCKTLPEDKMLRMKTAGRGFRLVRPDYLSFKAL